MQPPHKELWIEYILLNWLMTACSKQSQIRCFQFKFTMCHVFLLNITRICKGHYSSQSAGQLQKQTNSCDKFSIFAFPFSSTPTWDHWEPHPNGARRFHENVIQETSIKKLRWQTTCRFVQEKKRMWRIFTGSVINSSPEKGCFCISTTFCSRFSFIYLHSKLAT